MESIRILLIEDNSGDARLVKEYLSDYKNALFTVEWKNTLAAGLSTLAENKFDVILLDLGLPDSPQFSATFTRTQSAAPTIPIVVITGLDDETFAVTTVRRGAQDYLIKGKIDTDTLVRTIRYAIARKLGGEKRFTENELRQFDGKEGRPAYITFKGKIYDVSNSQLWKDGKHLTSHVAGIDLTEAITSAPHGEENLSKLAIVGELIKKETLQQLFTRRLERLHPHSTASHFSVSCIPLALIFFIIWLISGQPAFESAVFYLLIVGLISILVSGVTGIISWTVSYESKTTKTFNLKISLGILLFIIGLWTLIWRLTGQRVILSPPSSFIYLASFIIQTTICLVLDHYGKKIVYSLSG